EKSATCLKQVLDSCSWQSFTQVFHLSNFDHIQNSMKSTNIKDEFDPCHSSNIKLCNRNYERAAATGDCEQIKKSLPCLTKVLVSCSWNAFNQVFHLSNFDHIQNSMKCK
ncbi:unnamed protein product, partial [Lymnaea stagnalis]